MTRLVSISIFWVVLNYSSAQTKLIECWNQSYLASFDFKSELGQLESQLINLNILRDSSVSAYENLLANADETLSDLDKLEIQRYISPKPFLNCSKESAPHDKTDEEFKYMILFSIYQTLSTKHATIEIIVLEDQQIQVNNNFVSKDNLSDKLRDLMNSDDSVPEDEWVASMKVDPNVKMGMIIQIQTIIKEVGLKKVIYNSN